MFSTCSLAIRVLILPLNGVTQQWPPTAFEANSGSRCSASLCQQVLGRSNNRQLHSHFLICKYGFSKRWRPEGRPVHTRPDWMFQNILNESRCGGTTSELEEERGGGQKGGGYYEIITRDEGREQHHIYGAFPQTVHTWTHTHTYTL